MWPATDSYLLSSNGLPTRVRHNHQACAIWPVTGSHFWSTIRLPTSGYLYLHRCVNVNDGIGTDRIADQSAVRFGGKICGDRPAGLGEGGANSLTWFGPVWSGLIWPGLIWYLVCVLSDAWPGPVLPACRKVWPVKTVRRLPGWACQARRRRRHRCCRCCDGVNVNVVGAGKRRVLICGGGLARVFVEVVVGGLVCGGWMGAEMCGSRSLVSTESKSV